jgi:hypothetical protein
MLALDSVAPKGAAGQAINKLQNNVYTTDWFSDFIAHSSEELIERISEGLQSFISNPEKTGSICAIRK